jgi:uncharacterized protein YdhG (YjbR/CyaY superfamily)
MITNKPNNINEYIATFPEETQKLLEQLRLTIKEAAPEAEEVISYQMPAFRLNGILVYFAAYKNHIGFYPSGSGIANFKEEIQTFKNSKGTVQFPINNPLPIELISKIVKYRVNENLQRIKKIK